MRNKKEKSFKALADSLNISESTLGASVYYNLNNHEIGYLLHWVEEVKKSYEKKIDGIVREIRNEIKKANESISMDLFEMEIESYKKTLVKVCLALKEEGYKWESH